MRNKAIIQVLVSLFLLSYLSCENKRVYTYSNDTKFIYKYFNINKGDVTCTTWRIHSGNDPNSWMCPPYIEHNYIVEGIFSLSDSAIREIPENLDKEHITPFFPAVATEHTDWKSNDIWNRKILGELLDGKVYYNASIKSIYFKVNIREH